MEIKLPYMGSVACASQEIALTASWWSFLVSCRPWSLVTLNWSVFQGYISVSSLLPFCWNVPLVESGLWRVSERSLSTNSEIPHYEFSSTKSLHISRGFTSIFSRVSPSSLPGSNGTSESSRVNTLCNFVFRSSHLWSPMSISSPSELFSLFMWSFTDNFEFMK